MELTKKQKADIFAWLLNFGWADYSDSCKYVPSQHKYRYVSAEEGKTYYMSQKQLAHDFDSELTDEEREQVTADYFGYQQKLAIALGGN